MLYGNAPPSAVVAVTVVMSSLASVITTIRMYARFGVSKNAGRDDAFIIAAVVSGVSCCARILANLSQLFSWATTICMIAQVEHGLGTHIWTLKPHELLLNLRAVSDSSGVSSKSWLTRVQYWAMIIVYNLSLLCTKMSILCQYLRIFPQKSVRMATYTVIGIVVAYAIWRFFSAVFTCNPPAAFWDHSIKQKTCQDRLALSLASTTLNMITDIMIALLPLPYINKLQLPRRQKYALLAVFALAGLVVIVSILRLPALYHLMHSKDITWENPMASIWSSIEMNVAIICSCLPTLRCLFPKLLRAASNYQTGSSARSHPFSKPDEPPRSGKWTVGAETTFKGRFSTHVSSPSATYKTHKTQRSWTGRRDALLDSADDVELGDRGMDALHYENRRGSAGIHVHTHIAQESVLKGDGGDESPRDSVRQERQERGMI